MSSIENRPEGQSQKDKGLRSFIVRIKQSITQVLQGGETSIPQGQLTGANGKDEQSGFSIRKVPMLADTKTKEDEGNDPHQIRQRRKKSLEKSNKELQRKRAAAAAFGLLALCSICYGISQIPEMFVNANQQRELRSENLDAKQNMGFLQACLTLDYPGATESILYQDKIYQGVGDEDTNKKLFQEYKVGVKDFLININSPEGVENVARRLEIMKSNPAFFKKYSPTIQRCINAFAEYQDFLKSQSQTPNIKTLESFFLQKKGYSKEDLDRFLQVVNLF